MTAKNKQGYVYSKVTSDGYTRYLFKGKEDNRYIWSFWSRDSGMFRGLGKKTKHYWYIAKEARDLEETPNVKMSLPLELFY